MRNPAVVFQRLILDTNVVLDWLVFNDPQLQPLHDAARNGDVVLYNHRATLDELRRVLNYPALKLDAPRQATVLTRYRSVTQVIPIPAEFSPQNLLTPPGFPLCRDPDDQLFVALALHGAAALVSRDRAVLAMRKRAARFGVTILDAVQLFATLTT